MAPRPLLIIRGTSISSSHTLLAATAFSGAFILACLFHFKAVCKNGVAEWPIEWFPSVSATIGDHMPSRPFFQITIALCSGPRFLLILGQWLVTRREGDKKADWVAVLGVLRTFSCGGWVYITSTDGHDFHDFSMILYLLLTIPWMIGTMSITQQARMLMREKAEGGWWVRDEGRALKRRRIVAGLFFGSLVPMIYFFLQHKVHRVPGSYTYYSILEWSLIAYDVTFDAISATECSRLQIQIIDVGGRSISDAKPADGTVSGVTNFPSGDHELKHRAHSSLYTRFLRNQVQLNEPILPPSPIGPYDSRMEWPPHLSGWEGADVKLPVWRDGVAFLVDVFLAYCFWTIFTGLSLQLFYWSVWKLALSGSELTLFMILSPWLLSYPEISRFATSKSGQSILRGVALGTALTAYALPTPLLRLFAISIASVAAWLEVGGTLSHMKGGESAKSYGLILGCGLVISLLLKLWNYSNNPLWCVVNAESGGWNKTGLVLAVLAWVEKHYRPGAAAMESKATRLTETSEKPTTMPSMTSHGALLMGLGNLIFLLQTIITDAGTVIAWSWTGYPVKGPELLRQGFVPIASTCLGILLSTAARESWLTSTGWSIFGCVSCFLLVQYQDWIGFVGGCALIIFVASLFPLFLRRLSAVDQTQIGAVFGKALLANAIWDVVSVLTVAYAFVPGGQLFRERMDVVMYFSVVMVCWGLYDCRMEHKEPIGDSFKSTRQTRIRLVLLGSSIAGWLLCQDMWRHLPEVVPYHSSDTRVWTGGIWAVHFGIDEEGHDSQRRMLELIRDMEVDVVGLLETDLHRFVYGNRDLTRMIAEELGYYVDLGPGPNKHTWGAVLLSKFPILESTHHLLPSPHGELAPAIHAKLLIHGQPINVIVSHNGQEEDPLDRELQSTALAKIMSDHYPEPFAFLGYLVTHVGASRPAPYEIIMADGKMWDVEIEDRRRWCQYIAFRNMWRVAYARVTHATISDTELQAARWVLPAPGETVSYQSNEDLYRHWWEEDMDESWRFTRAFRGNGTRGHTYEVFDGPIYYLPPKQYQALLDKTKRSETSNDDGQSSRGRAPGPADD